MPSIAAPAGSWQHARFRWFYVGQVVSLVGSGMAAVALSFAVLESTGSASDFAAVLAAYSVTMLACFLFGGVLADRWPRARLLIGANTGVALSQGTVAALLLTDTAPVPALILLEAINGAAAALTLPARRGIIPQLVAPDALFRANAVLATSQSAAKVLGPMVGGIAVVAGGGWMGDCRRRVELRGGGRVPAPANCSLPTETRSTCRLRPTEPGREPRGAAGGCGGRHGHPPAGAGCHQPRAVHRAGHLRRMDRQQDRHQGTSLARA
ncbi:MAG: MFS transporter [Pseudonocardiaceae bacterium]